ncbi:hypothetical protein BpHYR1_042228 [Brachionus plicatilis]|uniref:Uncharacterized protein n=1 Tax=Brachionus plicatilis TaxID=10195 RepID=A0A3M7SH69_BRAPC|nr:hypothetical protein BpHYR1_042228 [Brachionus plicatilis]
MSKLHPSIFFNIEKNNLLKLRTQCFADLQSFCRNCGSVFCEIQYKMTKRTKKILSLHIKLNL